MDNQQQTVLRYHELLDANAAMHVMRVATQTGIVQLLHQRQRTLAEICEPLDLSPKPTEVLLECLTALGVIERYGDDYALAAVTRLLTEHDHDLQDSAWRRLANVVSASSSSPSEALLMAKSEFRHRLATSQWTHTAAAMQVANTLEIGQRHCGWRMLDFGCGGGVWSAAMAYRDPEMQVTAVDLPQAMEVARQTAISISLGERWQGIEVDPMLFEPKNESFDAIIASGWLQSLGEEELAQQLRKLAGMLVAGGTIILPDSYRRRESLDLIQSLDALRLELSSATGRLRTLREMQEMLQNQGFSDCQFTSLPASRQDFCLLIANKNA